MLFHFCNGLVWIEEVISESINILEFCGEGERLNKEEKKKNNTRNLRQPGNDDQVSLAVEPISGVDQYRPSKAGRVVDCIDGSRSPTPAWHFFQL